MNLNHSYCRSADCCFYWLCFRLLKIFFINVNFRKFGIWMTYWFFYMHAIVEQVPLGQWQIISFDFLVMYIYNRFKLWNLVEWTQIWFLSFFSDAEATTKLSRSSALLRWKFIRYVFWVGALGLIKNREIHKKLFSSDKLRDSN